MASAVARRARLAAAGLAVGKHGGVVALEQPLHQRRHTLAVQAVRRLRALPKHVVKCEQLAVGADLRRTS